MSDDDFRFQPDLARAGTIPARWYVDPAILEGEYERVFGRTWQLVGRAEEAAAPGSVFPCEVAREPLVVARGEDGTLRAFSNVCRHRAGPVVGAAGCRKALTCGYHGWTYGLDGRLLATPEWDGVRDFEKERFGLPAVRIAEWGGFLFACLDGAAPELSELLGAIPEETRHLPLAAMRLVKRVDYEIACNWKVYVDNYLEGYHIPIVHPGLFAELDYRAYRVETAEWHSKQHAPVKSPSADSLYRRHLAEGSAPEALYYWVFPNLMLNLYPDNIQTNVVLPLGPERTLTRFEWLVPDPERPGLEAELARSLAFSDGVQREDIGICEAVQRGLRSRTYDRGRYSVKRENGVHHFHGLLARALGDA